MSAEAPLEVFYRVEGGEVKSVYVCRENLPESVHEDRWDERPRFSWVRDEIRVVLDQKPR